MKMLHTSINVKDMDRTINFYTDKLGMKLESRREIKQNNAEIAFLSIEGSNHNIELTWWKDKTEYVEGDQLDHIAFSIENMDQFIARMKEEGVEIAKEPYVLGTSRIAFIKDPNGIWIEIIERK
ncbi:MAG: VOC family protein [Thermoplasmata archaeon]|nr:VOC family protein [Candidatus Sysuiplasma acidicola]MBX8646061.1 VOC family protein [Candidatus Sysuiplasma acidicola]MDH2905332.1 VOC family protein [Methanomassiliicoccales archaeon]